MDKAGVATAMLSQYSGFWFGDVAQARRDAREVNEWAAATMVAPYKNRFGLFAALPLPDADGSLKEIEYAFDTLHADGVSLITSYDGKWLGDPAFDPVFEELNRRRAVVFTHPLEPACCRNPLAGVGPTTLEYPTDTTRAIVNLLVSNAATRYPDIRFIFSHAGGTLVSIAQRILGNEVTAASLATPPERNSRLYHVRRFHYDTAGSANPVQLQSLKLLVPASQVVFGTDTPLASMAGTVAGVQASGLTAEEQRGVYRENLLQILPEHTRSRLGA
jgi:predicted TIM-barrel fold metal-dependent hydrolase